MGILPCNLSALDLCSWRSHSPRRASAVVGALVIWILSYHVGFAQKDHSLNSPYNHPQLSWEEKNDPDSSFIKPVIGLGRTVDADHMQLIFLAKFKFQITFKDSSVQESLAQRTNPNHQAELDVNGWHTKMRIVPRTKGRAFSLQTDSDQLPDTSFNSSDNSRNRFYFFIKTAPPRCLTEYLTGGSFELAGTKNDKVLSVPVKSEDLCIGRNEVTNLQFWRFLSAKKPTEEEIKAWINWQDRLSRIKLLKGKWVLDDSAKYENHPVVNVTWNGAKAFCDWLGKVEHRKYRLPTEDEWEFAARSGKSHSMLYPNGADTIALDAGNFDGIFKQDKWEMTAPVDSHEKNAAGLFHFAGNVREWCEDPYQEEFKGDHPDKLSKPGLRAVRGGSWNLEAAKYARLDFRDGMHQDSSAFDIGFRVVIDHREQ